jgi:hypothetical protein
MTLKSRQPEPVAWTIVAWTIYKLGRFTNLDDLQTWTIYKLGRFTNLDDLQNRGQADMAWHGPSHQ